MIDNHTINKNYPLPHPENIASQDVGRIADAISMVDEDISTCDSAVDSLNETVAALDERSPRIPQSLVGTVNTELQDLEPNRYIVVNPDGSGFSTVEGGGGEGGLRGEILVKRSNDNFDTMWVDPKALYKRAVIVNEANSDIQSKNNNVVILADEVEIDNGSELPRLELTARQITSDTTGDSQYSYIIADKVEEHGDDESDIASKTNFGRVKIGDGIDLDNGIISVEEYSKCSKTNHGVVKIGNGINVEDGVISAKEYPLADYDNFGLVKLSSDFEIADEGELILTGKKEVEEIIYQAANIAIVSNNCIIVQPEYAKYRLFIAEDSVLTFNWSSFVQEKDLAFDLEIISEHFYEINFDANIEWKLPCTGVSPGTTVLEFRKLLGSSTLFATIKNTDTLPKQCLTIEATDDILDDYICYTNGLSWNACAMLMPRGDYGWWNETSFNSGSGEGIWNIDFAKSTCVTSLYWQGSGNQLNYFYLEGSNDNSNWNLLLEVSDLTRWYDGETRQYYISNTTAYKYYKFTPVELQTSEFRIARFRLYKVLER